MPSNCTILCPTDDPSAVLDSVIEAIGDRGSVAVSGDHAAWSAITVTTEGSSLVLNRLVQIRPGDQFSKMVLGMHNYFNRVKTPFRQIKADILRRVADMALAIGVVAEPEFVESAGHYDCIFDVAEKLDGIIWTGSGVLDTQGQLLLDGEGNSEVAG